jgi:hypothetical protein
VDFGATASLRGHYSILREQSLFLTKLPRSLCGLTPEKFVNQITIFYAGRVARTFPSTSLRTGLSAPEGPVMPVLTAEPSFRGGRVAL